MEPLEAGGIVGGDADGEAVGREAKLGLEEFTFEGELGGAEGVADLGPELRFDQGPGGGGGDYFRSLGVGVEEPQGGRGGDLGLACSLPGGDRDPLVVDESLEDLVLVRGGGAADPMGAGGLGGAPSQNLPDEPLRVLGGEGSLGLGLDLDSAGADRLVQVDLLF